MFQLLFFVLLAYLYNFSLFFIYLFFFPIFITFFYQQIVNETLINSTVTSLIINFALKIRVCIHSISFLEIIHYVKCVFSPDFSNKNI